MLCGDVNNKKMKVCYWLDSNITGGIHMLDNRTYACCTRSVPVILDYNIDYSKVTLEQMISTRQKLFEDINNGSRNECKGCKELREKNANDINIGPIEFLLLGPFTTCNLSCNYCYYSKKEHEAKLDDKKSHILPILKNFYNIGFLKKGKNFTLSLVGGEPTLIEDLDETLQYCNEKWENVSFILVSNSSISNRSAKVVEYLKKYPKVYTALHTSIDCGTAKTFAAIKNKNLFYETVNNIYQYAINGSFNNIRLKYILMEDGSNLSEEDLYGFASLAKFIKNSNKNNTSVIIDADIKVTKSKSKNYFKLDWKEKEDTFKYKHISKKMLAAGGKLYYLLHYVMDVEVEFIGGRLSSRSDIGLNDVERIKNWAQKYNEKHKNIKNKLVV